MAESFEIKQQEETDVNQFIEPLKNPDEWWGYIPATFLEENENDLTTPFSDDRVEYKIVVTDETSEEGKTQERITSSETRNVLIDGEVGAGSNPNVDGRLYSMKVVENYPVIEAPDQPAVDWDLPAPNNTFPSLSAGEYGVVSDDFVVKYFLISNDKMKLLSSTGSKIRYARGMAVFFKVEFGDVVSPSDVYYTNSGNRVVSDDRHEIYIHVKCFDRVGNFYEERLKYRSKTGPFSAIAMTPFTYELLEEKGNFEEKTFWVEFLYPNMTRYDKVELFFEAEHIKVDGTRESFYSPEFEMLASDVKVDTTKKAGWLAVLDEWRLGTKVLVPVLRKLLAGSDDSQEKIKEESVFDLGDKVIGEVAGFVQDKIADVAKVADNVPKSVKKLGGSLRRGF